MAAYAAATSLPAAGGSVGCLDHDGCVADGDCLSGWCNSGVCGPKGAS